MPAKKNPLNLNALQLRTLTLLQELTRLSDYSRPGEEEADYALPVWAGVIPLKMATGAPVADDRLMGGVEVPGYVTSYLLPDARRDSSGKTA